MATELELLLVDVDDDHVVRVCGELDIANADRLRDTLIEVAGSTVVVDLAGLRFCDSSGIAALLVARQHIMSEGHGFVVRGAQGAVRRIFEVTGLADLLVD